MAGITNSINDFNKNKWIVRFSNLVDFTKLNLDSHILDNYVKDFTVPNLSVDMLTSEFGHERQLHPNSKGARGLQTINISFKMDEEGKNYYYFWCWLTNMRGGNPIGKKNVHGIPLLRYDAIDTIELCLLNNDKVMVSKMKFIHCIPTDMGSLELTTGEADLATFTITFDYENMILQPLTVEE